MLGLGTCVLICRGFIWLLAARFVWFYGFLFCLGCVFGYFGFGVVCFVDYFGLYECLIVLWV